MQLFDGIGAGTYGLSLASLTRALTVGTGRFSFTLGFIITIHMCGAALSNLIGGYVVNLLSYTWAFLILGVMGIVSVLTASFIQVKQGDKIVSVEKIEMETDSEGENVNGKDIRADEDTRSNNQSSLSV